MFCIDLFAIHTAFYYLISDLKPRFHLKGPSINLITYAPRGGGGGVSYTFQLRITCKERGAGPDSIKIVCILNGRPLTVGKC